MSGYRMEIDPPKPLRPTTRDLQFVADIYSESPNVHRWRAYVMEDGAAIVESNGGEQSEGMAAQAAREWLLDQARLLNGCNC